MGWGRQGRHQFLFRTLFLIHVGVSSHVQMWTFQKVPSRIAQSPFSAVPGGPGKACLLWGRWISERRKDSLLSLDLNCFSRGVRDVYWEGKLCLPSDRGLMGCVCRGDQTALSWLGCTTCPGKLGETYQVWSFRSAEFSASAKALIILISSQLITFNWITFLAGFLERFCCKWYRRMMEVFCTPQLILHSGEPWECVLTSGAFFRKCTNPPVLPSLLYLGSQPLNLIFYTPSK